MKSRISLVVVAAVLAAATAPARALDVLPGFDLFETDGPFVGAELGGLPLIGVPLGSFDFGAGPVPTGNVDTIVQRLGPADDSNLGGGSNTVPIEIVALQLRSVDPVEVTPGNFQNLWVVNADVQQQPGIMEITFDSPSGGTFNTLGYFVDYEVRVGSPTGPIQQIGQVDLSDNSGLSTWGRNGCGGCLNIPGVNFQLNLIDTSSDFRAAPAHTGPHPVIPDTPEPATLALFGLGGAALLMRRRTANG